jgi:Protein of unknown function (DUF1566)/PEP-CTERM motif
MAVPHIRFACRIAALFASGLVALSSTAYANGVVGQGTWQSTLEARDLDGHAATIEAYYDSALDITWLADASYAKTSGADADGLMSWAAAQSWVSGLNVGGVTGWRLPTMVDTGTPGCNLSYSGGTDCGQNVQTSNPATGAVFSEFAHLWYQTLGNKSYYTPGKGSSPQPGWGLSNKGPFDNVQAQYYWTGTSYATNSARAWVFLGSNGLQGNLVKSASYNVWAVHSGDVGVSPVPEPEALALVVAGLAVVAWRRKGGAR